MPNTIDSTRLPDRQREERAASPPPPIQASNPSPTRDDSHGVSDSRTRPTYDFRRGAINIASGRRVVYAPTGQPLLTIISESAGDIGFEIEEPSRDQQPLEITTVTQVIEALNDLGLLLNRIRRGLLYGGLPGVQDHIWLLAARIQNPSARRPDAMEESRNSSHRDTYRYGGEGWAPVEPESQRPATVPGSSFAVPLSTLNLFQSVDLFAPPPSPPTAMQCVPLVTTAVDQYKDWLDDTFNRRVAARRMGAPQAEGSLFTLSLELSRVGQLAMILRVEREDRTCVDLQPASARRRSSSHTESLTGTTEDGIEDINHDDFVPYPVAADDHDWPPPRPELEGWSSLDAVFDHNMPQEVCFHIGPHRYVYSMAEVEEWILNQRRRQRIQRAVLAWQYGNGLHPEAVRWPPTEDGRQILHTLAMPDVEWEWWQQLSPAEAYWDNRGEEIDYENHDNDGDDGGGGDYDEDGGYDEDETPDDDPPDCDEDEPYYDPDEVPYDDGWYSGPVDDLQDEGDEDQRASAEDDQGEENDREELAEMLPGNPPATEAEVDTTTTTTTDQAGTDAQRYANLDTPSTGLSISNLALRRQGSRQDS